MFSFNRIPLFEMLAIETKASCNRVCPGCIRNSHPDREAIKPWFSNAQMPTETIHRILKEALDMDFRGGVCLQHYNEPLQDPRIVELGRFAKEIGFPIVFITTNGDYLTEELAAGLDEVFDWMGISLYMKEPTKSCREEWIRSLFKRTKLLFTDGVMIETHYSRLFPDRTEDYSAEPCFLPIVRMVINHRGNMLMCCDDVTGEFDLGTIHTSSVKELWYSRRHQKLVRTLQKPGGRSAHPYCLACPRPGPRDYIIPQN